MTLEEMQTFLKRVTYKPEWRLEVQRLDECFPPLPYLIVTAMVEDTFSRGRVIKVGFRESIPPMPNETQFLGWVRSRLGRIELHERDEWLHLDDVMVFNPHREAVA